MSKALAVLSVLCLFGGVVGDPRVLQASSAPDYYDGLRNSTPLELVSDYPNSGVYQIATEDGTVRLADFKVFLPLSATGKMRNGIVNDAFTALLAAYHFNNIEKSPILSAADLGGCDLRLTTELFDSQFSPIETTRTFTSVLKREPSLEVAPPAAVVGAFRSAVTSPLAILTGINNIPQVSWASTAEGFSVKDQYPFFGRTVTDTVGEALVALKFFEQIKSTHVAVIFITDAYGSALQKAFQDAAVAAGIETTSIAFNFGIDFDGALGVMAQLKETQFRHVYAIMYEDQVPLLVEAATQLGVVGPDYFYLSAGVDIFSSSIMTTPERARAYAGMGVVQMQGTVSTEPLLPSDGIPVQSESMPDTSTAFGRFEESWTEALNDPAFVEYARSKLPPSLDNIMGFDRSMAEFAARPGAFRPFLYDALTSLGLSFCQAGDGLVDGPSVYGEFSNLDYDAASGRVKIDNSTGTRDYQTIQFVLWNLREVPGGPDADGKVRVGYYPSKAFEEDTWEDIAGKRFIYADGTETPPDSLPPVNFNNNYIGSSARVTGYTLMGFTMFSVLFSLGWLVFNFSEHVVAAAQPLFLFLVSIGALLMSSTIIPLSMEETTVSSISGLDSACMSSAWLYVIGVSVAFSPLFTKTVGIHQAYRNPDLDFIHVSTLDIFIILGFLLFINGLILLVWTLVSPLEWTRVNESATDVFNRFTSSYGRCESDDALAFVVVVVTVNFLLLLLANFASYQARNIETEFNESRYIGISMAAVLQAWCMGVPILIVVWDNPQGRFYVQTGIVFVTSQAMLVLVYVPKMLSLRASRKEEAENERKKAFQSFQSRTKKDDFDEADDDDAPVESYSGNPSSGMKSEDTEEEAKVEEPNPQVAPSRHVPSSDDPSDETPDTGVAPAAMEDTEDAEVSGVEDTAEEGEPDVVEETAEEEPKEQWRLLGSAKSSSEVDPKSGGMKIIHNPRTDDNMKATGGVEMSRAQMDYVKSGEDELPTHAASEETDDQ